MLWLVTTALAAKVSEASMREWLVELMPEIEIETGETFVDQPRLVLDTRPYLVAEEARYQKKMNDFLGISETATKPIDLTMIAYYSLTSQQIFVVHETLLEIFESVEADDDLLGPFVRCSIAHELTHALQHQRAQLEREDWTDPGVEALLEGQATLVARNVCGSVHGGDFSDAVAQVDMVSSLDPADKHAFKYGYGRRYVERLVAAGPQHRAVWAAFANPPTKAQIVAEVEAATVPGWRNAAALESATAMLVNGVGTAESAPASATGLLGGVRTTGLQTTHIVRAEGGLVSRRDGGMRTAMAAAFRIVDPKEAVVAVQERRVGLVGRSVRMFGGAGSIESRTVTAKVPKFRGVPHDDIVLAKYDMASGEYRELWVARAGMLVGVAAWWAGGRVPKLEEAALEILAAFPAGLPHVGPLIGASPERPPPAVAAGFAISQMLSAAVEGDLPKCVALSKRYAAEVPAEDRSEVLSRGYSCAVETRQVAACDSFLADLPFAPPYETASVHAQMLYAAGRRPEALTLLEQAVVSRSEDAVHRDSNLLIAYSEARRWADARRMLRDGIAEADAKLFAATTFYNAGFTKEALSIAKVACPQAGDQARRSGICERYD